MICSVIPCQNGTTATHSLVFRTPKSEFCSSSHSLTLLEIMTTSVLSLFWFLYCKINSTEVFITLIHCPANLPQIITFGDSYTVLSTLKRNGVLSEQTPKRTASDGNGA